MDIHRSPKNKMQRRKGRKGKRKREREFSLTQVREMGQMAKSERLEA